MIINLQLNTGTGKNGKQWYQVRVIAGKYSGEPYFVSQLEYEYLEDLIKKSEANSGLDLEQEN